MYSKQAILQLFDYMLDTLYDTQDDRYGKYAVSKDYKTVFRRQGFSLAIKIVQDYRRDFDLDEIVIGECCE